ncbi:ABC transporter substrate-binding protein [Micromonospora wenchangensis]|uniref:ABC transporter substrate-binding protein n=1 Tax=Micromonospora wenchangensis TaxID=1185415 RepID=UPI001304119D|nr:ABC transporter substrate-binding protein [Micromonospora wenchangensis]
MHNRSSLRHSPLCVALLVVGLTACGTDSGGGTASQPTTGGALTYATPVEPDCLDPAVSARDVTALVDRNIFDSLVQQKPDGSFQPWLAERWETAADGRSYTFHLRTGVRFHDGTPLDAGAVKATLDHAVDPATESRYAAGLIAGYQGTEVVDPHTAVVRLDRPNASFLQALSAPYLGIQSPRALQGDPAGRCDKPVGSGPYRFVKWEKKVGVELSRNPDYAWPPKDAGHTGPARLDSLKITFVPEDTVRVGALTSGQVQAVASVPPGRAKTLGGTVQVLRAESPGAPYTIYFNSAPGTVLADVRVRQALRRAVDLDQLVKAVYFGQYQRAWSPLTPATPFYDDATKGAFTFDQAEANRLLDEAGWTTRDGAGYRVRDGRRLTLRWPHTADMERDQRGLIGQGVQAQARQVGIEIQYTQVDQGTIGELIGKRALDLFDVSFTRPEPDILRYFFGTDSTLEKGGGNIFGLDIPGLDKLLTGGVSTLDQAERTRLYADAQRYVVDNAISLPVYVPTSLVGVTRDVHGIEFGAGAYPLFYDAWIAR